MVKNILITGASRGIGRAIADLLNTPENKLILLASKQNSFADIDHNIDYFEADFSSFSSIQVAAQLIQNKYDHIDVLVNNLGIYVGKSLTDTTPEEIHNLMDVNFSGPAYFTRQILPLLKKAKHAQIINMSSIAAKKHLPDMSIYAASKGAVSWFSNSLRAELNPKGIRVSILHPTGINTWNDPHPELLLYPTDLARTVKFIIDADPKCQIEEMTISSV